MCIIFCVIYSDTIEQIKNGNINAQTIEAALGGEEYNTYKNALGNYNTLKQKLNELESIDNRFKTQEQATKEVEIKSELEQTRIQAKKLKNILENKIAEKIDTDNIHLRGRESYLWDSYIKGIQKPIDNTLNESNSLKNTDENEVIAGMWEDSPNSSKNNVEKSQLESVENFDDTWYNNEKIITDGSHLVNGKLKPNVIYKSGEYDYIYATDEIGRISDLHTDELQYTERNKRLKYNSNTLGKESGDHAGHLIGDRYGGSPEVDNLVSQSKLVNLSEYKKIENIWAKALNNGRKVSVDVKVQYDGNSMRPSSFIVYYTVDGIKFKKLIQN